LYKLTKILLSIGCIFCLLPTIGTAKESLKITLMVSSADQRSTFFNKIKEFEKEHPEIEVTRREIGQETYKAAIEGWLHSKKFHSDVLFWFAGAKLDEFVSKEWVEPIDDIWKKQNWDKEFSKTFKTAVTTHDKTYGLPISYYQWGFYYRKSIFRQHNLRPPQTWKEFIQVGETLKANNIVPIALGSKDRWAAAGWFDYLNLRINGLPFHQNLMKGKVSYTDPRIKEVFRYWKELLDHQFFLEPHNKLDWRSTLPYIYRGKAGMLLMGNFLVPQLPKSIRDDIGFFRFPQIKSDLPYYEEAPIDILIIPHNARNKKTAKQFLAFMGRADIQCAMNNQMGMISPNQAAEKGKNQLIQAGYTILEEAAGITQFYDRDTPSEMSASGMDAMIQFLNQPMSTEEIEEILEKLDKVREQVFQ